MQPLAIPGISDPVSSLTHLFGAVIYGFAAIWLLRRSIKDSLHFGSIVVFVGAAVFLLTMSGLYHMVDRDGPYRTVLERLDHLGIFLLIAGTFTPAITIIFTSSLRRWLLASIWGATFTAIMIRLCFFDSISHAQGVMLYLFIGWTGVFPVAMVWKRYGTEFVMPLLMGALVYTFGGIFEAIGEPVVLPGIMGPHEQFHIAVLLGVGMHWYFMHQIASGDLPSGTYHQESGKAVADTIPTPAVGGAAVPARRSA